jgi:2,3-diketo-5-methylthio-1-phosphopentane phosphatase
MFAEGEWQKYEDLLEAGEINVEKCLELEFKHVKSSKDEILKQISSKIEIREGFVKFVEYCKSKNLELIIVSAGLDFVIDYILTTLSLKIPVIVPKTAFNGGITFTFPKRNDSNSEDFKADFVKKCKNEGNKVIFIGDGGSDYYGAKYSDYVFAVENKSLSKYLQPSQNQAMYVFNSFDEITNQVDEII